MNKKIKNLLSEKDANWRFPGNVRDNFRSLYTICEYDKNLLSGKALGKIITSLLSIEAHPGGPYYSEFPSKNKKNSIVKKPNGIINKETNKSISKFLSLYDISLPALESFLKRIPKDVKVNMKSKNRNSDRFIGHEKKIMVGIREQFDKVLFPLPKILQEPAKRVFENTIVSNTDKQMSLMAYYFKIALGKKGEEISQTLVETLGMINILFWSAFIIYDDFWDKDEKADPLLLPVANTFSRIYTDYFTTALSEKYRLRKSFHTLMDKLDAANIWEIKNCRAKVSERVFHVPKRIPNYGDYTKKYEPASGHILGPVLILSLIEKNPKSGDVLNLMKYFKHYLIAMQLNDDMHDLEEDIKRGHISTSVELLLRDLPKKRKTINLQNEIGEIKKVFWSTTMPKLCKRLLSHTKKSRAALARIKSVENPSPLERIINICEYPAEKALKEYKNIVDFTKAYNPKN